MSRATSDESLLIFVAHTELVMCDVDGQGVVAAKMDQKKELLVHLILLPHTMSDIYLIVDIEWFTTLQIKRNRNLMVIIHDVCNSSFADFR